MTQELHATLSLPFLREEHHMLRDALRRFIEQEVVPHADAWEAQGMVPRNVLRAMGDMGWLGMRYDSEHGGSELDPLATVVLAEELGRSTYGGFAVTVLVHTDMASPHLHHAGNDAQKRAFMPALCSGEKIAAVAMTEADAGSDLASMRTT
ncbi:MAG: acyl-CoA dehydrogenase family protein, partial [Burkholderiaceae bacterium]